MDPTGQSRRRFLAGSLALLIPGLAACRHDAVQAAADPHARLADIEQQLGGRLGVAALDTVGGARLDFRADERFPMCSTFKLLLCACVLARVQAGQERMDRVLPYTAADLLEYAPVTRQHLAEGGMRVDALCAAAMQWSDNTAANLLLATLGGPAGLTRWLRGTGDTVTRLDRVEPELNAATPGDVRDTTTPAAMLASMNRLLLGPLLAMDARRQLLDWLVSSKTGSAKLRAGLPSDWTAGDKTGMGRHGATNDIAILWPPRRAPILVAAYSVGSGLDVPARNAALAGVARVLVQALA